MILLCKVHHFNSREAVQENWMNLQIWTKNIIGFFCEVKDNIGKRTS